MTAPLSQRLLAIPLNIGFGLLALRVRAAVLLALAGWFVVPLVPGLVLPPAWTVAGLLLIVGAVIRRPADTEEEEDLRRRRPIASAVRDTLVSLLTSLVYLIFGALVRWLS